MISKQLNFHKILNELELREERFSNLFHSPSFQLALERLEDLKRAARKQRRVLAKKYHPDKPGGSTEKMQEINFLVDAVLQLQIKKRVSRSVHIQIFRTREWNSDFANTNRSTFFAYSRRYESFL